MPINLIGTIYVPVLNIVLYLELNTIEQRTGRNRKEKLRLVRGHTYSCAYTFTRQIFVGHKSTYVCGRNVNWSFITSCGIWSVSDVISLVFKWEVRTYYISSDRWMSGSVITNLLTLLCLSTTLVFQQTNRLLYYRICRKYLSMYKIYYISFWGQLEE